MVGIVVISHSSKIAEGVVEMALQMAPEVPMIAAGGTSDGRIGTDVEKISEAIKKVYSEDGVLIIFDLGSAYMNAEMAMDFLIGEVDTDKIEIVDCALIEGGITAAVESSIGSNRETIKETLKPLVLNKMP
ncbi:dihydroxyacetone kinase phosphoryl donor subunit DhaM [Clostridium frigidicarnis]|uniref:phosphoenolpyruvate--glycerone phosphotransferase n=1 Tax=Clostridium frigidicarnis TaxID=84698 RepID=A0A1I0YYJ7_9CLOT|nr:dihydroxyacetone kinase phosphoryl donor subunit DhaM [Clostridium frigidicarnis]SFB18434.1 dihydroxyacetone kinase, phosphotransfer subunit [Clostridium frigidicarnis]